MDQAADIASSNTGRGRRNGAEAYRAGRFIAAVVVVMFLCFSTTWAQQPANVTIRGMVQDASGNPVNGASIRFERDGAPPAEITTNAEGAFAFPATAPGSYSVRAEKSGRRSRTLTVNAEQTKGEQFTLILNDGDDSKTSASSQPGAMEFADAPNFTIAAVTDWTAAGGHGSDAVLRTSESLNRETLNLKPGQSEGHSAERTAEWKTQQSALRAAVAKAPGNFAAHHALGKFYLQAEQFADALPPLESAYRIDPKNHDNELDLARALKGKGDFAQAREHVQKLLASHETAEVHRLAGQSMKSRRSFDRGARIRTSGPQGSKRTELL